MQTQLQSLGSIFFPNQTIFVPNLWKFLYYFHYLLLLQMRKIQIISSKGNDTMQTFNELCVIFNKEGST